MGLFKNRQQPGREAMATEPVRSLLLKMAAPSIVAMLMQAMYNTVDSMYVARISDGSLAAVTIAFPVQMIMGALSTGIGVGINSCISRNLGAKDPKEAGAAAANGLTLGLVTVVIMALFGIFGAEPFVRMYTSDPEVVANGIVYVRTICLLGFGSIFCQLSFSVLQGSGSMLIPMVSQIAGGLFVIMLDPIFIFGLGLGVQGAAIASSLAQIIGMAIGMFGIFVQNKENLPVTFRGFRPDFALMKDILSVGIPSALTQCTTSVVAGIVNKQIAIYGTEAITLYGSYTKLSSFVTLPIFGITRGMNPILGFACGEQNANRFKETRNFALKLAFVWTAACFAVFQLMPTMLLALMNIKGELVQTGITTYRLLSISMPVIGLSIVMTQQFPPLKKSYLTMISALLRQIVFLLPLTILMRNLIGVNGIWIGIQMADYLNFVFVTCVTLWVDKKILSKWVPETERDYSI